MSRMMLVVGILWACYSLAVAQPERERGADLVAPNPAPADVRQAGPETLSLELTVPPGAGELDDRATCPATVEPNGPAGTPFAGPASDARLEAVYLASEFNCDGTIVGLSLNTVGSAYAANNFTIRLQQTGLTALASNTFLNSGWTTCHQANVTIGTGWRTFTFTTPFAYLVITHILVRHRGRGGHHRSSGPSLASHARAFASPVRHRAAGRENHPIGPPHARTRTP